MKIRASISVMKLSIAVLAFLARHFLAVVLAMGAGFVIWTLVYVVLLIIAVIADKGMGGPLAYPAGLIAVAAACVVVGWGIFAPAVAVGAIFCGVFRMPRLAAIPVVWLAAFGLSVGLYGCFVGAFTTHLMPNVWSVLKNFCLFLSVPLGAYWWLTEGPGAVAPVLAARQLV